MKNTGAFIAGLILILIGGAILLDNLGYGHMLDYVVSLWPLLLIYLGVRLLIRRSYWSPPAGTAQPPPHSGAQQTTYTSSSNADYLVRSEVFGDIDMEMTSTRFGGGNCSVVFGGIDLDLTKVDLLKGENFLRLSGVFGDIKVKLPVDMALAFHGSLIAGEIEVRGDRRSGVIQNLTFLSPGYETAEKKLNIYASIVFGEIKVR